MLRCHNSLKTSGGTFEKCEIPLLLISEKKFSLDTRKTFGNINAQALVQKSANKIENNKAPRF